MKKQKLVLLLLVVIFFAAMSNCCYMRSTRGGHYHYSGLFKWMNRFDNFMVRVLPVGGSIDYPLSGWAIKNVATICVPQNGERILLVFPGPTPECSGYRIRQVADGISYDILPNSNGLYEIHIPKGPVGKKLPEMIIKDMFPRSPSLEECAGQLEFSADSISFWVQYCSDPYCSDCCDGNRKKDK